MQFRPAVLIAAATSLVAVAPAFADIGFAAAAALLGRLRDAGLTSSRMGLAASIIGAQAIILFSGSIVLSAFVGADNAIAMGVAPFLAGDLIKTVLLFTMIRSLRWNAAN